MASIKIPSLDDIWPANHPRPEKYFMKKPMFACVGRRYTLIEKERLLIRKISKATWPSSKREIAQEKLKLTVGTKIKAAVANQGIITIIEKEIEEMTLRGDPSPDRLRALHR